MTSFKQNEESLNNFEKSIYSDNKINLNEIKIIKRTLENNTHEVLEDQRLRSITSWRKSKSKFYKNLIFNILTLGFLHYISLHYPSLYIKLYCNPWPAKECDFFLVENIYGNFTLCSINQKKQKNNELMKKFDVNAEKKKEDTFDGNITNKIIYTFKYKSMNYEYKVEKNEIIPIYMDLSRMTNKDILNSFGEGLFSQNLVELAEARYGKNEYIINPKLMHLYLKKVQAPSFLIILFSGIGELFLKDYLAFIIKLIFTILIGLIELIYSKNIYYNIYKNENTLDGERYLKVKRKYLHKGCEEFFIEIKNKDLLPGDIIYLQINETVPCDCLILEGECIVNQNNLNGSLDLLKKISITNNKELFNYQLNYNNILLHGMKIINIFSKIKEKYISVLCINTGPNTYKANQYSNILYYNERKKGNKDVYNFFGDDRKAIFIGIIALIIISILLGVGYTFALKTEIEVDILKKLAISCFARAFFKSLMSAYFFIHSIILIHSLFGLKRKNILCYDKSRLLHSNDIDTIFLSKTNLLSESLFKINTFNPVFINNQKSYKLNFKAFMENQCKEINLILHKYYKEYVFNEQKNNHLHITKTITNKKINSNEINVKINKNMILFLECLLSCNNLERINNNIFGNIIERNIFDEMKWDIKTYDKYNYLSEEENNNKINLKENSFSNNNSLYYNCKYSFENNYNFIYEKISEIFPKNFYRITESLKEEKEKKIKKSYISRLSISEEDSKSQKSIRLNPIIKDLSKCNFNSYKLRIYKRFIKDGTLISSAIVYNFITKELRFMTKGFPEDILDKCDKNSIPENLEKQILLNRSKGYLLIICATKLIDIKDYNDNNQIDYYMNNLTFCGFVTFKNELKNEIKQSINELKKMNYNLILNSGDNLFHCLSDGFKSGILKKSKNIFVIDKDEKNKIIINKLLNLKNFKDIEAEKNNNSDLLENLSKQSKKTATKNKYFLQKTNSFNSINQKESLQEFTNYQKQEKRVSQSSQNHQIFDKNGKYLQKEIGINNSKRNSTVENIKTDNFQHNEINKKKLNLFQNNLKRIFHKNILNRMKSNNSELKRLENTSDSELKKTLNRKYTPESKIKKISKDHRSGKKRRTNFEIYKQNHYYYPNIFHDYEELNSYCIYCINGKAFNFLYKNKQRKQFKYLLKKIYENCKIFYDMTSVDKSLSVEFFREFENSCICYIGKSQSDSDAILTSNIGINLDQPKNQNTILSHFYSNNSGFSFIKNIILEGKAIHENIIFLKMASIFCTMVINSYILCCFFSHIDIMIGQLNLLEIILIIFLISAFTTKTNNKFKKNPFINNKKIFNCFYSIQIIGLFIIKLACIYLFCSHYFKGPLENRELNSQIFCTFYFSLCLELLFSSVFIFNYNSFYRKFFWENRFFLFFTLIFLLYLIILLALNSSNFRLDLFNITYFEYLIKFLDTYSDRNKMLSFHIYILDFGFSYLYSRIIYYIFYAITRKYKSNF